MKNLFTKFLAISSVALLMLASCKKDEIKAVSTGGKSGTLSASTTTLVLTKAKINDASTIVSFNFTNADYGYNAAVSNTLQLDVPGDNWAKPISIAISPKTLLQGYNTLDFNKLLLKLNLPTGVASQVSIRVMHSISSSVTPIYSNVVNMTVTPFALTSYLYVPGAYQEWHPSTADSLLSATSNGIYTGIISFPASALEFKIVTSKSESWNGTNYGLLNGVVSSDGSAGNFAAPGAGLYWVTLDLNANTIAYAPVSAYYSLIGDATAGGWGSDTDMKYNNGTQMWEVTAPLTAGGSFKIRKNHDWGTSYGTLSTPDGVNLTSANGGNIPVTVTGTYKVTFAPSTDGLTATYTLTQQ